MYTVLKTCIALTTATLTLAGPALASRVHVAAVLANPVLAADTKQTTYLKVGLTGFDMPDRAARTPVNLALVIDKSGSMQGQKMEQAKAAALAALDRLDSNDIISVVAYSSGVEVLVPATKVSDKQSIRRRINRLGAAGSTALFAGTSKGAAEVRKFLERERVNRIILLSDGLANIGPETPSTLGALGRSLGKEGIAVSTLGIGLGYGEDLMSQLALQSDGNHAFIEHSRDIAKILKYELGDVLSVVAQEVVVTIDCKSGVRPVKVLGRESEIVGQRVLININQLYSQQEKYVILEVEVDGQAPEPNMAVANVAVSYANMSTQRTDAIHSEVVARLSASPDEVNQYVAKQVMAEAIMQVATLNNALAVAMRDEGKQAEAQQALEYNGVLLRQQAQQLDSKELAIYARQNDVDARNLDESSWKRQRKVMRDVQFKNSNQRSY
jgi:Ca-activated chloride channel family protein